MRAVFIALLAAGCASYTQLSPEDRLRLDRQLTLEHPSKFAKLSFYVAPFFGDATRGLLLDTPPALTTWRTRDGNVPAPAGIEHILQAGTPVRLERLEFATGVTVANRPGGTPRDRPWVVLVARGEHRPLVLVLRSDIESYAEFVTEVSRYFSDEDPSRLLAAWTEPVRQAVRTKSAAIDMPAEALLMSWGYPDKRRSFFEGSTLKEDWTYAGGRRVAHFSEGRLASYESELER